MAMSGQSPIRQLILLSEGIQRTHPDEYPL